MATPIDVRLRRLREEAVRAWVEARNAADADRAVALFAQPRLELIASQRVYEGAEALRTYLLDAATAFPDLHFEVTDLHHADDAVIAETTMSGTHDGAWIDLPASGRHFRCRACQILQFDGTALVGVRFYHDRGTIARQLA